VIKRVTCESPGWDRRGRYDRGPEANERWLCERETLYAAFDSVAFTGNVLELASGTGTWTRRLARTASLVTAIDASPEMHEMSRATVPEENMRRIVSDIFDWSPDRVYEGVVFGFWISHVPSDRLRPFLETVASAIRPGAPIFFVDGLREPSSTATNHVLPASSEQVALRKLNNGRSYRIVKTFHDIDRLSDLCLRAGLDVVMRTTPTYFYYGVGVRTAPQQQPGAIS
jgi:2-polyprenyl-3-methyl-5-hydroxy-6-metoxy-1,4-benzoquinol methylase